MLNLIRTRRAMAYTHSPIATPSLTTTPTIAATAPTEMDHRPVNPVDPIRPPVPTTDQMSPSESTTNASGTRPAKKNTRGPCRQLKTGKVTQVTNAPMAEHRSALAYNIGHVVRTFCPIQWKSWKTMPEETKNTVRNLFNTNYNLEDMKDDMFAYLNQLFSERYKQWKSGLHQCFQQFDDPQVALEEGCPKELEDRQDSWVWLCGHFQEPGYVKKVKANKINREKKTLLHHSGLRPFSYRMEARRKEGSKFSKINVLADVYVRPGNELTKSLHVSVKWLYDKRYFSNTCGWESGCYSIK
ncbi:hypothetical protein D8674_039463 [Pyrus ussuriensis x Pyrus communis]|uniref:Uncharacterized protein n=1 Tax=Pyrus ussuriensis x Pyrus communis TaxID=2448454 RepID=A0A5N5H2F6_9ROSA|nr:hypothetical protein D8674_039463 [Pyrus ussuriensis x Pyrus communis]